MKTLQTFIRKSPHAPLFRFFVEDHESKRRIYLNLSHEKIVAEHGEGHYQIEYDPRETIFNTCHCWASLVRKIA